MTAAPQEKTSASGKPYVQAKMRAPTTDGESTFVLLTEFDPDVCRALLAHAAGNSIAVSGPLRLGIWQPERGEPRMNVSMIVSAVLSTYAVKRRREAMRDQGRPERSSGARASSSGGNDFHDDALDGAF
ncbi:single-stranded DNA-binding protein [Paraburkholderia sp. A3BS-1L]|uniref:single-stranded DNA-binding protein n=1 Tax=Paraburkholderia sp. A3BS-1L TaxID=3028375 RepID=UPI003DA93354